MTFPTHKQSIVVTGILLQSLHSTKEIIKNRIPGKSTTLFLEKLNIVVKGIVFH